MFLAVGRGKPQSRGRDQWTMAALAGGVVFLGLILAVELAGAQGQSSDSLPAAPAAPNVYDDGLDSLTVVWVEPEGAEPAVTGFDIEYRRRGDSI